MVLTIAYIDYRGDDRHLKLLLVLVLMSWMNQSMVFHLDWW